MKFVVMLLTLFVAIPAISEVKPSRGNSFCEKNPADCSWGGPGVSAQPFDPFATPVSQTDTIKTSQAAPRTSKKPIPMIDSIIQGDSPAGAVIEQGGNLPKYLSTAVRASGGDGIVIVAEKLSGAALSGIRPGDMLEAGLEQSIKASPSVPTPIRARIKNGRLKGAFILGSATFDKELKRILLTFERLRIPGNETGYALKATGLAPSGQIGLEGDHHTQEGLYFAGEILAATAAGYADATTQRNQTMLGTYQMEPSVANAAKQGAVNALSKTADRFAERGRSAPEYTEIEAGREIKILIQETPTEITGS